ncbi:OmpA family protein [Gloeobacter violaceus]|uniref:Glr1828 protein n=1 Tax=Gloeobacter violaceus (strain ATCC 29082 / PCC 7421) TaxID=251221 RepID=Q7NJK4_GLOVI|nr:OmpA family protein [Gloeobacter violaceus]BAC89769.1 glr1828 [Gloeobacter violaceus PCC 7421]
MRTVFVLRATLPALVLLLVACGNNPAPTTASRSGEPAVSTQPIGRSLVALDPSEVALMSPTGSETAADSAGGSATRSTQIAASETQVVNQILSDFNAQRTASGIVVTLPEDILFDFDKADLRPSAQVALQKMAQVINFYKNAPIEISGHTDSKGADGYNRSLSERRAEAVRSYLANNFSVTTGRLTARGLGEGKPVAPNTKPDGSDDPAGRQKNRRVEILIKNQPGQ